MEKKTTIAITGMMFIALLTISLVSANFWACFNKGDIINYCDLTQYGGTYFKADETCSSSNGCEKCMSNFYEDTWDEEKTLVILQDQPYPSFVNAINVTMEVGGK